MRHPPLHWIRCRRRGKGANRWLIARRKSPRAPPNLALDLEAIKPANALRLSDTVADQIQQLIISRTSRGVPLAERAPGGWAPVGRPSSGTRKLALMGLVEIREVSVCDPPAPIHDHGVHQRCWTSERLSPTSPTCVFPGTAQSRSRQGRTIPTSGLAQSLGRSASTDDAASGYAPTRARGGID